MKATLGLIAVVAMQVACLAQDSLGDLARQQRFARPAQAPPHEITNDDIASAASTAKPSSSDAQNRTPNLKPTEFPAKKEAPNAAEVQTKIRAQKDKVKALENKIAADQKQLSKHDPIGNSGVTVYERVYLNGSGLGFPGPGFCSLPDYAQDKLGYKDWCDEPDKLQDDMDAAQKQLDSERAILDSMQEEARLQGFGNAIYDPD